MKERFFCYACIYALIMPCIISCKKDPVIPNQEELITTLIYTLTPIAGGEPVVLSFEDLDGDGGNPPVIHSGNLQANTTYAGTISLLDKSSQPTQNISEEIRHESADHQFFYSFLENAMGMVSYTDTDPLGFPLGIETSVITGNPGDGKLSITLRHFPRKDLEGVREGMITNAGGETDIEVIFEISIQ